MTSDKRSDRIFPDFLDIEAGLVFATDLDVRRVAARAEFLTNALGELTAKQRFVVECSWGLRGDEPHTFREIATLMGLSGPAAVKRHYDRGMACLRGVVNKTGVSPYKVDEGSF